MGEGLFQRMLVNGFVFEIGIGVEMSLFSQKTSRDGHVEPIRTDRVRFVEKIKKVVSDRLALFFETKLGGESLGDIDVFFLEWDSPAFGIRAEKGSFACRNEAFAGAGIANPSQVPSQADAWEQEVFAIVAGVAGKAEG
jgi:hypothetical protein